MFGILKNISWDQFRIKNIQWWVKASAATKWSNEILALAGVPKHWALDSHDSKERVEMKKKNYDAFLADIEKSTSLSLLSCANKIVGEVCCGPLGGIIECYELQCKEKYFIDIIMDDYEEMNLVEWSENSHFIQAPTEHIHLENNKLDILFGYNSIDHGWDWKKSIDECLRISKKMFLMFDTKNEVDGDWHPQKISHQDVLDYAEQNNWHDKFKHVEIKPQLKNYGSYEMRGGFPVVPWPETWVYVIK